MNTATAEPVATPQGVASPGSPDEVMPKPPRLPRRVVVPSVIGPLTGGLVFLLVLLDFGTNLGRQAVALGYAANFFEAQGNAFLDGRLDVPAYVMGIEGFVVDDRTYMYFGPFPAILRIPVLLVTDDFVGEMTAVSMLLAFVVFAVFATRLLWLVRRAVIGDSPVTTREAVLAAIFLAGVTGGTTLTFDAGLPWVYHEVYLWQTALVVAAAYWLVRLGLEPTARGVAWLGAVLLCAVLTRTTGGWGACLGAIALALWMFRGRSFAGARRLAPFVLAAGLLPLAVGVAYNMVKFGHPYLFPLQDQVWTSVNQHRRFALDANGGTITGPQFFSSSLVTYFDPRGIRFVDYFPWITLPGHNAPGVGGAVIDQSYRAGSVTAFMPLWLLMAVAALPVVLRRSRPGPAGQGVRALRPAVLATVFMTGGVMAYGYLAHRYTSEFVPALVLGSAITLWSVVARLSRSSRALTVALAALLAAGGMFSTLAQAATGFAAAATTFRGPPLVRYLDLQDELSGGPGSTFAGLISHSGRLPIGGSADELHVRGACDGLYLNTGDHYEPWVVVEERSHLVSVALPRQVPRETVDLFVVHGKATRHVFLQTFRDGTAQVGIRNESGVYYGPLFRPFPDEDVRVGLRTDPTIGYVEVTSTPGGFVGYVPLQEWYADWVSRIGWVEPVFDEPTALPGSGLRVRPEAGLTPPLCVQLVRHNGVDLR